MPQCLYCICSLEDLDKLSAENRTMVDRDGVIVLDDNIHAGVSPEIKKLYFTRYILDSRLSPIWGARRQGFSANSAFQVD